MSLTAAAGSAFADKTEQGRVHAKPRLCVPKGADVVVRYRIDCSYSLGSEDEATITWNAIANLRSGWISYRRKH